VSDDTLARRLGVGDAVVVGLGSMLGAGVFAAFGPAAHSAGSGLLVALALAAAVAYCNATSSARLAALYPVSGGTYVYGRERLGPFWGYLAGAGFVVGKTASCAAMALTVGAYLWPDHARAVAVAAVVALTAINYRGIQRSAAVTRVLVAVVLAILAAAVVGALLGDDLQAGNLTPVLGDGGLGGVLQGAGFLFFAFAGYARIATLGEEVREPERTIPRAITLALVLVFAVYLAVALALLLVLGPTAIARSTAPLADAVSSGPWFWLESPVRVGAGIAAAGSLLALILGVSRTTLAMARDGHLPRALAAVHSEYRVPHRAELAVGAVVIVVVLLADLRGAIGFSSMTVLVYYAIANASALTLGPSRGTRVIPAFGLAGCLVVAGSLPWPATIGGLVVLVVAAAWFWIRRRRAQPT
jgi:basic amino acid/polyamine antiporter, APA family